MKIKIDHKAFAEEYGFTPKFAAKDEDGSIWLFEEEPSVDPGDSGWTVNGGYTESYAEGYCRGTVGVTVLECDEHWLDSLTPLDYTEASLMNIDALIEEQQKKIDEGKEAAKEVKRLRAIKELIDRINEEYSLPLKKAGIRIDFKFNI